MAGEQVRSHVADFAAQILVACACAFLWVHGLLSNMILRCAHSSRCDPRSAAGATPAEQQ